MNELFEQLYFGIQIDFVDQSYCDKNDCVAFFGEGAETLAIKKLIKEKE